MQERNSNTNPATRVHVGYLKLVKSSKEEFVIPLSSITNKSTKQGSFPKKT